MEKIQAYKDLKKELLQVEKPARYTGGELGSFYHKDDEILKVGISFPDIYEIGMSNQAIRILYNRYNRVPGIQCERVFAPFMDFEEILKTKGIPLFTLETGIPLKDLDILAFSIGYELTLTNMLTILETGQIPLRHCDRDESHPLIVAGGPAATNPEAFSAFVDAVYIGEGEPFIDNYGNRLVEAKKKGASREDLLSIMKEDPAYWYPGKKEKTIRSVFGEFGTDYDQHSNLPLASLTTVQDHGVIEIMRGCPNGCRFCHAGYYYRPFRQKNVAAIMDEAEYLVSRCGFRNITLSSLSSGDYRGLLPLVEALNNKFRERHISFQLPSLRVNSLNLDLLGELSAVRKSGLTFAVETPVEAGQAGINKDVSRDKIISLLQEAKNKGWKLAKFYFMVGLPVNTGNQSEGEAIVDFLKEIQEETRINMNVNVGVFIPKPHTPYDREKQLNDSEGMKEVFMIKEGLKGRQFKVGFHSPYSSFVEGIISRGDHRTSELIEKAYRYGARFDAWDEYHDRNIWKRVVEETDWDVETETCRSRSEEEKLPWDNISLRVSRKYLTHEYEQSEQAVRTPACDEDCENPCGVCGKEFGVKYPNDSLMKKENHLDSNTADEMNCDDLQKAVISFAKKDQAVFLGHLDTVHVFERAFQCADLPIKYTEGYNPKPKMEFAHPLSVGITGDNEILGLELLHVPEEPAEKVLERINSFLPSGFLVNQIKVQPLQQDKSKKKRTLMGLYAGSDYVLSLQENKSGIDAEKMLCLLNEKAIDLGVEKDYIFSVVSGNEINVRALFRNKKMNNVSKFLIEVFPENNIHDFIDIRRTRLLVVQFSGEIKSYLDLDSSQS